jgi:hypothetical protein
MRLAYRSRIDFESTIDPCERLIDLVVGQSACENAVRAGEKPSRQLRTNRPNFVTAIKRDPILNAGRFCRIAHGVMNRFAGHPNSISGETPMKHLAVFVLALFGIVRPASAEIITVPFSATLTRIVGRPFGIVGQVGVTPVSGSFSFDTLTPPDPVSPINNGKFDTRIASGFVLQVGGVTVSSSIYAVDAVNDVLNFGGSDIFRAIADNDLGDFRVNGIPHQGSAEMTLVDTDQNFYPTNADAFVPPTRSQLALSDFNFGFLGDELGTGGGNANFFEFRSMPIPEPEAIVLLAFGVAFSASVPRRFAFMRHRRSLS